MKYSILACNVFKSEIENFVFENAPLQIEFFEISLHLRPEIMRGEIEKLLEKFSEKNEFILLMFGLCGNAALGIKSAKFKLVIPRVHECLSIFLGSSEKYYEFKTKEISSYFSSPGWAASRLLPSRELEEQTRRNYSEKFADDPEMVGELMDAFKEQYKMYDKFFYVDFIGDNPSREYCKGCAKYLNWKFEEAENPDTSFFCDALNQNWRDEKRFLTVPRGKTISRAFDERILDVE